MANESGKNITEMMEQWFAKAPPLPANAKDAIVKIAPILSLVFGILGILVSISGLGVLTAFAPLAVMGGASNYGSGFISSLVLLGASVLLLVSYSGLKDKKIKGWNMLFLSEVVNLVGSVIALSLNSLISGIIGALISFYLLYQIKSYYK